MGECSTIFDFRTSAEWRCFVRLYAWHKRCVYSRRIGYAKSVTPHAAQLTKIQERVANYRFSHFNPKMGNRIYRVISEKF